MWKQRLGSEDLLTGADLIQIYSKARIVTNESIANDGRMVPAALDLPPGKLFFGFTYKPYDPKAAPVKKVEPEDGAGVSGAGNLQANQADNSQTGLGATVFRRCGDDLVRQKCSAVRQQQCHFVNTYRLAPGQRRNERGSLGEAWLWCKAQYQSVRRGSFRTPSRRFLQPCRGDCGGR